MKLPNKSPITTIQFNALAVTGLLGFIAYQLIELVDHIITSSLPIPYGKEILVGLMGLLVTNIGAIAFVAKTFASSQENGRHDSRDAMMERLMDNAFPKAESQRKEE